MFPELGIDESNGGILEDGVDIRQRDLLRIESYRYFILILQFIRLSLP